MEGTGYNSDDKLIQERIKKKGGEVEIRNWVKGRFLGKGGFAKWYEFTNDNSKKVYAAKVIQKSSLTKKRAKQKLISEIKIHKSLNHKHVVGFEHYFEDSDCVYILLELWPNQSLNELLRRRKRLHELEVMYYTKQIIDSLLYLHKNRVIHRDLKLGNLFINEKLELKLGDFGLATKLDFDGERKRTIWGTPNYIAPEVLEGKNGHSYEVDIWSLGVIIYTLIIGKPPFETSDVKKTYDRIRKNSYAFPDHIGISEEARDLIQWILNNEPDNRPTLQDIIDHKFLSYDTPEQLHPSLLACPPSSSMIKKYLPSDFQVTVKTMPKRLEATAPAGGRRSTHGSTGQPMTAKETLRGKKLEDETENAKSEQPDKIGSNNPAASQSSADVPIHAKKWIDYTSKYGLGYILSNGSVGVFFNDATKIILEPEGNIFDYYERKDKEDVKQSHGLDNYPKEIEKKVTLLAHFKSYLDQNFKKEEIEHHDKLPELIYVKKWIKTRHAKMFRLSNKVVQVYFKDKTEILLWSQTKRITYTNKEGERGTYPLTAALESNNEEMNKRMQYTKNILTHLLQNNTGA